MQENMYLFYNWRCNKVHFPHPHDAKAVLVKKSVNLHVNLLEDETSILR